MCATGAAMAFFNFNFGCIIEGLCLYLLADQIRIQNVKVHNNIILLNMHRRANSVEELERGCGAVTCIVVGYQLISNTGIPSLISAALTVTKISMYFLNHFLLSNS